MIIKCCECEKEFEYNETFFNFRRLKPPKRCPACRGKKDQAEMLFSTNAIYVNLPLGQPIKTIREDSITSYRYKLNGNNTFIYVYDLTLSEYPYIVSVRIMKRANKIYAVFDYPQGIPKYELVKYDQDNPNKVWFLKDILEVKEI